MGHEGVQLRLVAAGDGDPVARAQEPLDSSNASNDQVTVASGGPGVPGFARARPLGDARLAAYRVGRVTTAV